MAHALISWGGCKARSTPRLYPKCDRSPVVYSQPRLKLRQNSWCTTRWRPKASLSVRLIRPSPTHSEDETSAINFLLSQRLILLDYITFCRPCDVTCQVANSTAKSSGRFPCMCDDKCYQYHDCCVDAPNIKLQNKSDIFSLSCVKILDDFYYMNRTCRNNFPATNSILCQSSSNYTKLVSQGRLLRKLPVTIPSSGITYGNIYCARCNNVPDEKIQYWNMSVTCQLQPRNGTGNSTRVLRGTLTFSNQTNYTFVDDANSRVRKFVYNKTFNTFTVRIRNATRNCTLLSHSPKLPSGLKQHVRRCVPSNVTRCNRIWSGNKKCSEYQSVVSDTSGITYRNRYCAQCSGASNVNLTCKAPSKNTSISKVPMWLLGQFLASYRNYFYIDVQTDCNSFLKNVNFTKIIAEIVRHKNFTRAYTRKRTNYNFVKICRYGQSRSSPMEKKSPPQLWFYKILANCGVVLSILLQLLYLRFSWPSNTLMDLNQKNMILYTISVLMGNAGFLLSNFENLQGFAAFCDVADFLTYFGFLGSLCCISAIAFEMSCTVWRAGTGFAEMNNVTDYKKLLVYSTFSWGTPIAINLAMMALAPRLSNGGCAYTSERVFLLFFVFPLIVTMSVNLAFYISSIFVLHTSSKTVQTLSKMGIEFKFHTRLLTFTYGMWIVSLLAIYCDSFELVVLFSILDLVLALSIYVHSSPSENIISRLIGTCMDFGSHTVVKERK